MPRTKMTGKERQALGFFFALLDVFYKHSGTLEGRLRAQGGSAWREWRLAHTLLLKSSNALVDSLTDDDLRWEQRLIQNAKVSIDMPGPLTRPDYMIVDTRDMMLIGAIAGSHECALCVRQGKDVKRCRLRDALMRVSPLPDGEELGGGYCEFVRVHWDQLEK